MSNWSRGLSRTHWIIVLSGVACTFITCFLNYKFPFLVIERIRCTLAYLCLAVTWFDLLLLYPPPPRTGSKWLPPHDAGRVLVTTWLLASLVFMSSYSGILTAMLSLPRINIPIDSLTDLVAQDEMPWKLEGGSSLHQYFKVMLDNTMSHSHVEETIKLLSIKKLYFVRGR